MALGVVETDTGTLRRVVKRAALYGGGSDPHDEMFVRVESDRVETPGSAPGASQATYCTFRDDHFDRLSVTDGPVDALFDVSALLGWLEWFPPSHVTLRLEGEDGVASRLVLEEGDGTVGLACEDDPAVLSALETFLPGRFEGTTFLDGDGFPLPTRIETTAATLSRLVGAVDRVEGVDRYPLEIRDGSLALDVTGERETVSVSLSADVSGPAVTNHYGPGFARVVGALDGPVTLRTGPAEAVAFVQDEDAFTLRFVVLE